MLPFGAPISDLHRTVPHSRNRSCLRLILLVFLHAVLGSSRAHSQAAVRAKPAPIEFVQEWGVRGTEPGQLESPVDLAADPIGRLYIADRTTGFVQKFEASGIPLL